MMCGFNCRNILVQIVCKYDTWFLVYIDIEKLVSKSWTTCNYFVLATTYRKLSHMDKPKLRLKPVCRDGVDDNQPR